ncbi:uncharacterized protein BO66DRAFT_421892 [Aspergillus aculeatinus CBS 121060]|uniref:Uncharacterized protein n=1 Tax=Aspergillus aculeatinus CBS 121060 TaxID=1448322 RepID=A0ACD1H3F3_9EURO|nr:hypothetical protein BO66DRAFT_421892 [Aspergillus aculeatinus CBS 121060]RAH68024.1 hypothetical protein BO66DRAFT_421892 [Aspergillus aculeatinus CBS 121060]
MRTSVMLAAITPTFLTTLCHQTMGRLFPINEDRLSFFGQRTAKDDPQDRVYSCPAGPARSTTERTRFGTLGCTVYGYPSTGGVLIKEADLLDMLFLSLPRSHVSQRSPSAEEEDRSDWLEVQMGLRQMTEEEEKVIVYGWPADGVGVWVLRFASANELPDDFGRMNLAMNMEEKIQIMKEYGATFVEDVTQVEELNMV